MKKTTTIAIASIFAASALFAVNPLDNPDFFGYNVDTEFHSLIDLDKDLGYNVETEFHSMIDLDKDLGYNVETEFHG